MNYLKVYNNIIEKARCENRYKGVIYYESHHIIPKCLGGSNKKENLIFLTPKEHFICHRLLIEIHRHNYKSYVSMLRAFVMMSTKNIHQSNRYINSRIYENVKNKLYGDDGLLTGKNATFFNKQHSQETKEKLSNIRKGDLNPQYGKPSWNNGKSKNTDFRISEGSKKQKENPYNKNRPKMGEDTRKKLSEIAIKNNLGKNKSNKHKTSISKKMKDIFVNDSNFKTRLLNMSKMAAEKTKGVKKEKVECPYCKKTGGKPAMMRFHFNNCKEKTNGS